MKILLINISLRPDSKVRMFPVGLGYVATAVKQAGHDLTIYDLDLGYSGVRDKGWSQDSFATLHCFFDKKYEDNELKYDAVLMGTIVSGYKHVKKLSHWARCIWPESVIVVGNTVAGSIPDHLLDHTDTNVAVIGEGDYAIIEILDDIQNGIIGHDSKIKVHKTDQAKLDSLPFIDYTLWNTGEYIKLSPNQISDPLPKGIRREDIKMLPVNTARGCAFNCTFCYHAFAGYPWRRRSWPNVLQEIYRLHNEYDINYVGFSDELTFATEKDVVSFLDHLDVFYQEYRPKQKIYWMANARADLFKEGKIDRSNQLKIIKRMAAMGCHGFSFSLESADTRILKDMKKKISVDQFKYQTRLVQDADLPVWTSLVFGYPTETPETIKNTFKVCSDLGIFPSTGFLLPQPGSEVWDWVASMDIKFPGSKWEKNAKDVTINRRRMIEVSIEDYLMLMGDRQDFFVNLTDMSNDEFEQAVKDGAKECAKALSLAVDDPIKTQFYRGKEK